MLMDFGHSISVNFCLDGRFFEKQLLKNKQRVGASNTAFFVWPA